MAEIFDIKDELPVVTRKAQASEPAVVEEKDEIIITTKAFVPEKFVDLALVEKRFSAPIYVNDQTCNQCYWVKQRPCQACNTCANFSGYLNLYKRRTIKGVDYVGIPLANWSKSLDMLGVPDLKVRDLRPDIPMRHLKFTGKLYTKEDSEADDTKTNQIKITDEWLANAEARDYCGLVISSPRSGKGNMSLYLAIEKLKKRTLITCAQIEWLLNFCEDMSFMTNLPELVKKGIYPVVLVSKHKDYIKKAKSYGVKVVPSWDKVPDDCDVVLSSYVLLKKNPGEPDHLPAEALRKYVIGKFTTLIVDETHQGAAPVLSSVINNIDVTHRIGLSATADRMDGMSFIIYKIMGPAAAISNAPAMVPYFELFETGIAKRPEDINTDNPTAYETWLSFHKDRNKIILRKIFEVLDEDPLNCIILPVRRVNHVLDLVRMINQTAAFKNSKEGKNYPQPLAIAFADKQGDRTKAIDDARSRKVRVTVAIEKIVKHALSVPAWTHIFTGIVPISNGPMFYQLYSRVSTPPKKGQTKPQPKVIHLVDATSSSVKTLKNLYESTYDPLKNAFKDEELKPRRLVIEKDVLTRLLWIMARPYVYAGPNKDDQLNRIRRPRTIGGGFSSKRAKDTR